MSEQLLNDKAAGLRARINELQSQVDTFNEAKGLDRAILKTRAKVEELETDIQALKESGAELKEEHRQAVQTITEPIMRKLDAVLPNGMSGITIEGKSVDIAWIKDNKARPYKALSGGEKASFDAALAAALGADVIVVEAAEIDQENLSAELEKLAEMDQQVIVLTCHEPEGTLPEKFEMTFMKAGR